MVAMSLVLTGLHEGKNDENYDFFVGECSEVTPKALDFRPQHRHQNKEVDERNHDKKQDSAQ